MIELKLIPDGNVKVPGEAKDHRVLRTHLEDNSNAIPSVSADPIESWRDVKRTVPGSGEYVALRVPGVVADYDQTTLDAMRDALTTNINGLKAHPEGWQAVETQALSAD